MRLIDIEEELKNQTAVLIYFSGIGCNVCHSLKPKIEELFKNDFPKVKEFYLDIEEDKEIAIKFNIFAIPTILLFLEGKEFIREGRMVSISQLKEKIARPYSIMMEN